MCVLQVTLAYESTVLYMCEGKVLMDRSFSSASTKIIPTEMKKVTVRTPIPDFFIISFESSEKQIRYT